MNAQLNRVVSFTAGTLIAAAVCSNAAAQVREIGEPVVYSTGFEYPAYLAGPLVGQDEWAVSPWVMTKGVAMVQGKMAAAGSQAVRISPELVIGRDAEWMRPVLHQTTLQMPIVEVEWDMYFAASKEPSLAWEFKLYGPKDTVLCTMSVVSRTHDTVHYWVGGPVPVSTDTQIARNQWNRFKMRIDFIGGTIDFYLNKAHLNPLGDRPWPPLALQPEGWVGGVGLMVSGPGHDAVYVDNISIQQLAVECPANCDESWVRPVLNANDFLCFMKEYSAAIDLPTKLQIGSYANFDKSVEVPVLNANDFMAFLGAYASGCP